MLAPCDVTGLNQVLREQEELHPAEISGEYIGEDGLVNPRRRTVHPSQFQEGPCYVVDYLDNLHVPSDDDTRLEQDRLVERGLCEQLPLGGHFLCRKTTGRMPRIEFLVHVRPVRMYGEPDIRIGVDKVLVELVQRLVYHHAGVDVYGHCGVRKLERVVADVVQYPYHVVDSRQARVFGNVVYIPGLALHSLVVGYQQVMDIGLGVLDFPQWLIAFEDTLDDSVLVHFARRLGFLDRLTTWLCVCGTYQTPQKRR